MKAIKSGRKKETGDVAGRIAGIVFLLIVIGAGYYLFSMFRTLEVTPQNIAGDWKHKDTAFADKETHWVFVEDGTASSYTLDTSNNLRSDIVNYTYTLGVPEGKTYPEIVVTTDDPKKRDSEETSITLRVSRLCRVEMSLEFIYDRFNTETTRFTKRIF